jgi:hypothetical protein
VEREIDALDGGGKACRLKPVEPAGESGNEALQLAGRERRQGGVGHAVGQRPHRARRLEGSFAPAVVPRPRPMRDIPGVGDHHDDGEHDHAEDDDSGPDVPRATRVAA